MSHGLQSAKLAWPRSKNYPSNGNWEQIGFVYGPAFSHTWKTPLSRAPRGALAQKGMATEKRKNGGGILLVLRRTWSNFTSSTGVSAASNAGRAGASLLGRVLWIGAFVLGLVLTLRNVLEVTNEYNEYPINTLVEHAEADRFMFPAVTVCNQVSCNSGTCKSYLKSCVIT